MREFARHGAWIGLIARDRARLDAVRREVEDAGGRALVLVGDVADAAQMEQAVERVETELGPLDIWINNAMVSVLSPALAMTAEEYRRVTEVTYLGYVHGTLSALRRMVRRNRGTIVQIGSALAYRSIPLQSAYCGAKHAIQGFTDSLRSELIHDRSRVHLTTVQLPAVNTPQFSWIRTKMPRHPQPVPPIFQPEVIARAVYWAAHHRRREVTVGWPALQAIVGNKFIPGLLDHYLAWKGYDAQQTERPVSPDRRNNLFETVAGPYGAHGEFDDEARTASIQFWLNRHRAWLTATGLGIAACALHYGRRATRSVEGRLPPS
ncbi:short-chain dehydrogenase [Nitrospira sp.]|nr:short-chain dehydrogenase [Nitrospira sp.]